MKKSLAQKLFATIGFSPLLIISTFAQTWDQGGNSLSGSEFLGTTNTTPLIMKTDNSQRIVVEATGEVKVLSLSGSGNGLVLMDNFGQLLPLSFLGAVDKVLCDDGAFHSITGITGWTFDGITISSTFPVQLQDATLNGILTTNDLNVTGTSNISNLTTSGTLTCDDVHSLNRVEVGSSIFIDGGISPTTVNEIYTDATNIDNNLYIQSNPLNSANPDPAGAVNHTILNYNNQRGNVGIGIVSPQNILHIHDRFPTYDVETNTSHNTSTLQITNVTTGEGFYDGLWLNNSEIHGYLQNLEKGGRLSVYADNDINLSSWSEDINLSARKNIHHDAVGEQYFKAGNSQRMVIQSTGEVGIGITNPQHVLEVNGNISLYGNDATLLFGRETTSAWGQWGIEYWNNGLNFWKPYGSSGTTGNNFLFLKDDNGYVGIGTNNPQTRLQVDGNTFVNGRLGVGTSNPTTALEVIGEAKACRVTVEILSGCDYVFEENYCLPSISEKANFLLLNKHLPDVPKAKTMETNGMDLGTTTLGILKNTEEMMLYIINLENRIKELESRVNAQK